MLPLPRGMQAEGNLSMPDGTIAIKDGKKELAELFPSFSPTRRNRKNERQLMLSFRTTDAKEIVRIIQSISTPSALKWFSSRGIREIAGITRNNALIQFMLRHYPTRIDVPSLAECRYAQMAHLLKIGAAKKIPPKYANNPFRLMVTPIPALLRWSRLSPEKKALARERNFAQENNSMRQRMAKGLFPSPDAIEKSIHEKAAKQRAARHVLARQPIHRRKRITLPFAKRRR